MNTKARHWLNYDSVAFAVLVVEARERPFTVSQWPPSAFHRSD